MGGVETTRIRIAPSPPLFASLAMNESSLGNLIEWLWKFIFEAPDFGTGVLRMVAVVLAFCWVFYPLILFTKLDMFKSEVDGVSDINSKLDELNRSIQNLDQKAEEISRNIQSKS